MSTKDKEKEPSRLRIVSLGGVDEIGKNMYVFEYEDDIVVVDCGSVFPKEDMLGVDLVIPDITYLMGKRDHIRGYLFTHGHEDHIGATPYILKQAPAHIYGTKLTMALVDLKLKEYRVEGIPMHVVPHAPLPLPALPVQLSAAATLRWTIPPSTARSRTCRPLPITGSRACLPSCANPPTWSAPVIP